MAIALVLGSASVMLWLGRWKLAVVYVLLALAAFVGFFLMSSLHPLPVRVLARVDPGIVFSLPSAMVAIAAMVHGFLIRSKALRRPWYSRWYVALPLPALLALGLAALVRTFLFHPFNAPSLSMLPNEMIGDYFFVSKAAYQTGDGPQRGQIAVFSTPANPGVQYVKRVVGMPDDRLQMKRGTLHINGVAVPKVAVILAPEYYWDEGMTFYRETLPNGASYVVAETANDSPADDTGEFVVPARHYFMMGDNRDNSNDSRFADIGFIPAENFVGPVSFRIWNSLGFALSNRPEQSIP